MIGYQKMVVLTMMGCTAIGVVTFALAPINGILGAGVTVAAAVTLSNLTRLHSVKRRLGLRLCNRGCLKPVAAGVLAVGATSLAELVLPLPAGIWTVLVVGPVFLVWFVALLMAFGLSSSDRQLLAALWKAVRRAVRRGA